MSETASPDGADERDETDLLTRIYFWGGILSAAGSWLVHPSSGFIAMYCGYKIYRTKNEIQGSVIAGAGGIGVLLWLAYLLIV